jgi:hypothetical protein
MAGIAQKLAAWPEQAGMHDDRYDRDIEVTVEPGDAVLVVRRGAGGAAGAFRVDDELSAVAFPSFVRSSTLAMTLPGHRG